MDISALVAKAHIPQIDAAQIKVGDAAEIKVEGEDEPVASRVTIISPALDPGSTTVEVWVETRKPSAAVKPGMTVNIEITAKTVKDAIAVPSNTIFKNADGASYVLIAGTDKKAHQRVVQVGVRNPDLAQIISGVNAGDPVIVSGGYAVPDGTTIEIEKPSAGDADKDSKEKPSAQPDKDKD
jgi:RND family efflux transporter MFP subunit